MLDAIWFFIVTHVTKLCGVSINNIGSHGFKDQAVHVTHKTVDGKDPSEVCCSMQPAIELVRHRPLKQGDNFFV